MELKEANMPQRGKVSRFGRTFQRNLFAAALVLACFGIMAFGSRGQDGVGNQSDQQADLSRLVVIGDSLAAGFQNDSLLATQQVHGFAAFVASQAHVPLVLPLIAPPGIPNVLELVSPGPPPILTTAPGISIGRLNPTFQATDLAVPGAT